MMSSPDGQDHPGGSIGTRVGRYLEDTVVLHHLGDFGLGLYLQAMRGDTVLKLSEDFCLAAWKEKWSGGKARLSGALSHASRGRSG